MAGRLEGRVALISGIARGQGRSHAARLAEEGADIIGFDICAPVGRTGDFYPPATEADLEATVALVSSKGRRVIVDQVDVRNSAAVQTFVDSAVAELGRLDIVVGNAGIYQFGASVEGIEDQDWADVIDVNLTGVWNTCKAALPHVKSTGAGSSLTLIASGAGLKGLVQHAHYVSAKHGLIGLMRTLANELGPLGIRANVVAPTTCDTDMIRNDALYKLFVPDIEEPTSEDFEAVARSLMVLDVPWVEPIDISNAVLFLSSDEARYITGVVLPVDAGLTVK